MLGLSATGSASGSGGVGGVLVDKEKWGFGR